MSYIDLAKALIKRLEACRLVGYLDSAGVPTTGYGHTDPSVKVGVTSTQEIADHDLDVDLGTADHRLSTVCYPSVLAKLADHQRAALISFVFNVGAEANWTIWKDIDAGNLSDVPAQLRRFDKATVDGKLVTILGLDNRREAEIAFWNTADIEVAAAVARPAGSAGVDAAPPSHTTVTMITPPAPIQAPPLAKTSLIAKCTTVLGGGVAALASQAQQIHGIVSPYVDNAKVFATLDTAAVGVIVAAGIVGVIIHAHQAEARAL
jgi:lysozyme